MSILTFNNWMDGLNRALCRRPTATVVAQERHEVTPWWTPSARKQAGIGALEYIGIALFFVVVLGGVLARSALLSFTNNNVAENGAISALWQSIKTNVKSSAGYGAAGTNLIPVLSATNGLPANLTFDGTNLENTYGQPYAITSTGMGFQVSDPGITKADCIKIVVQQASNGNWNAGITVNGATLNGAVPTATAQTNCSGSTNTVIFATSY
ncbi:type 4 pilus major pilin [Burkholderia pseudomallei]|uniref:type 4 pilus major pilin n=1 Tax=Burkholderia pseudomallei TaxID=28450 RepID=UPI0012F4CE47|nr:type 4 pilus major pilin [Burkholderia pseudomallei]